jgi:transcriptional regulator with XRE-family HTH domain
MLSTRLLQALVKERQRQGLTQKDLANRMGVRNVSYIQKIEYNKGRDIKVSTIERYAAALGVNLEISVKH